MVRNTEAQELLNSKPFSAIPGPSSIGVFQSLSQIFKLSGEFKL